MTYDTFSKIIIGGCGVFFVIYLLRETRKMNKAVAIALEESGYDQDENRQATIAEAELRIRKSWPRKVVELVGSDWDTHGVTDRIFPELQELSMVCPICGGDPLALYSTFIWPSGSWYLEHLNEHHKLTFAQIADKLDEVCPGPPS